MEVDEGVPERILFSGGALIAGELRDSVEFIREFAIERENMGTGKTSGDAGTRGFEQSDGEVAADTEGTSCLPLPKSVVFRSPMAFRFTKSSALISSCSSLFSRMLIAIESRGSVSRSAIAMSSFAHLAHTLGRTITATAPKRSAVHDIPISCIS
ncbi:hypothetical protein BST61_g9669 [Cercospora zeina]